VHLVSSGEKRAVLSHLLRTGAQEQTLVFTRTKHGANRLAEQLERDGVTCAAIHGNKSQNARTKALEDFKSYKVQVLVATDIAARGLDITELPQVVNYELPHVPEDYVHRIGRTGRAGSTGQALSLVSDDERDRLRAIERVLGRKINVLPLDRTGIATPAPEMGVVRRESDRPQGQQRHGQRSHAPRSQPAPAHVHRPHGGGGSGAARPASAGAPRRRSSFR
jgi:ATP-dependent RNA helicase RhlE